MLGKRFARIVEECLHRLDRGENLPDVLADYPADAEQLKPLLLVAMASRSIAFPVPSETARRLGRNHMLAEMDKVGSPSIVSGTPLHERAKGWSARLINTRRAQRLIQPAPNYRLAVIALVVVFGSGLFFLSASASSPGDFFTAFSTDFQTILEILNQGFDGLPFTDGSGLNRSIKMNGGEKLPSGVSGNEKAVLLLDGEEEDDSGSYGYRYLYQEKDQYMEGEPQDVDESGADEDGPSANDPKQEDKDLKKAEKDAEKAAREADREAERTLRQEELADKLEQKKAAIEAKLEEKELDKEEKEEEKDKDKEEEGEDID